MLYVYINYNNLKNAPIPPPTPCPPTALINSGSSTETVVFGFTLSFIIIQCSKLYFAFGCASHVLNNDLRIEENVFLCRLLKKKLGLKIYIINN